jgi:GT2 family glycosyltransferase
MWCDIIIPVWNQLALTTDCVNSILKNTDGDYRLIIVDNASDDKTRDYLGSLKEKLGERLLLMRNETNTGFIKASNKGMQASEAAYVCLLNNDTLVTKGWLSEMMRIAESSADIGIVNPSSNNLGQKPDTGEPVELYAEKLKGEAGRSIELGAAIGFCMLVKRAVIDRIGYFDEIYGMGNYEDTDYSRKAIKEGFRCVRSCGAYVYHRESTSFSKIKTFEDDFKRNKEIFEFRWGKPKRIAYVLDSFDDLALKQIRTESMKLARGGNWVWCFSKDPLDMPRHSNIRAVGLPAKNFYLLAVFNILKKKKKFDKIFVGDGNFARVLSQLAFIHKAKVQCY